MDGEEVGLIETSLQTDLSALTALDSVVDNL